MGPTPSLTQAGWGGESGSAWPRKTDRSALTSALLCARHWGTRGKPGAFPASWLELLEGEMDVLHNLSNHKNSESCRQTYCVPGNLYI